MKPTVLLACNPERQSQLAQQLGELGFKPVTVRDGTSALRQLKREPAPRVVILDWNLPGMDGPEICFRLRSSDQERYTFFILITNETGGNDEINGYHSGADALLRPEFELDELRVRLAVGLRILALEDRLQSANEVIRRQATRDHLTSLHNRRSMLEQIEIELNRGARQKASVGMIAVDVDEFKQINDTYGHPVGDAALKHVADILQICTRSFDVCGRYGGDEFLIALPNTNAPQSQIVADRIVRYARKKQVSEQGFTFPLTLSCGVVCTDEPGLIDPDGLIRLADEALYDSKKLGRNRATLRLTAAQEEQIVSAGDAGPGGQGFI